MQAMSVFYLCLRVIRVSCSLGTPFNHKQDQLYNSTIEALPFPLPLCKCTLVLCFCTAVYPRAKFLQCPLPLLGTKYERSSWGACQALSNALREEVPTTLCHCWGYTADVPYSLELIFLQNQKWETLKVKYVLQAVKRPACILLLRADELRMQNLSCASTFCGVSPSPL